MVSETSRAPPVVKSAGAASSAELAVNLQIVSPTIGVNTLLFPDLPASTTIGQLKDKIRSMLPLKPANENQRLIHRGRALVRESDSLLDIFGTEALQVPDRQTMHLVIRDSADSHSSSPAPSISQGPSPASANFSASSVPQAAASVPLGPHTSFDIGRRAHSQPANARGFQSRMPSPSPTQVPQHADPGTTFQHHHQNMSNWISSIQREAMARAIVQQNQQGRARMGMRGIGDLAGGPNQTGGNQPEPNGGRASPAPTHTYREVVGPNGQSYHVETVTISTTGSSPHALSPLDVQNILLGADASQAAAMSGAVQGNAPAALVIQSRALNRPGITVPGLSPGNQMAAGGGATPDLAARSVAGHGGYAAAALTTNTNSPRQAMDVYIVSSPEGPRALLLNNATSEAFYTPRLRPQSSMPHLRTAVSFPNLIHAAAHSQPPAVGHQQQHQQHQQHQQQPFLRAHNEAHFQQAHAQVAAAAAATAAARAAVEAATQTQPLQQGANHAQAAIGNQGPIPVAGQQARLHPANPPAAGIRPLLLQAWPHIWLVFRLAAFFWLFTSPASSLSAWLTIICLAVLLVLASTGILDGIAENAWRPIGRHLENILPTPEQHIRRRQRLAAAAAAHGPGATGDRQPLLQTTDADPAQLAARLVAEHERRSWLSTQLRRLERAGLLFVASMAPGVAERHIANLEAEAQADAQADAQAEESRRRAAEEATSAAATETAAPAERNEPQGSDRQGTRDTVADGGAPEASAPEDQRQGEPRHNVPNEGIRGDVLAF